MARANTVYTLEGILRILWEQWEVREAVRREVLPSSQLEMSNNFLRIRDMFQDMVVLEWDPGDSYDGLIPYLAAREYAERRYALIAFEMGLEPRRLLSLANVWRLTMQEAAREYADSQLDNFKECLMIAADSPTQGECYVVAEVWGTTCYGDVGQAVENARMATRLTGRPAYPAVAAFRRAGVPRSHFTSSGVHWHRLPRHR